MSEANGKMEILIDERIMSATVCEDPPRDNEPRFSLLYVYGWDAHVNEPTGGRMLGSYKTFIEAYAARKVFADGASVTRLLYGRGYLVITRRDGTPLLAPEELRGVQVAEANEEESEVLVVG